VTLWETTREGDTGASRRLVPRKRGGADARRPVAPSSAPLDILPAYWSRTID
jgi:hypothetical protein